MIRLRRFAFTRGFRSAYKNARGRVAKNARKGGHAQGAVRFMAFSRCFKGFGRALVALRSAPHKTLWNR